MTADFKGAATLSAIGVALLIALVLFGDAALTRQAGAALAIASAAALLISQCAYRVSDPGVNEDKLKRRASAVEAIATGVGLPSVLFASGADVQWWTALVALVTAFVLAIVFAGTRR